MKNNPNQWKIIFLSKLYFIILQIICIVWEKNGIKWIYLKITSHCWCMVVDHDYPWCYGDNSWSQNLKVCLENIIGPFFSEKKKIIKCFLGHNDILYYCNITNLWNLSQWVLAIEINSEGWGFMNLVYSTKLQEWQLKIFIIFCALLCHDIEKDWYFELWWAILSLVILLSFKFLWFHSVPHSMISTW